MTVSVIIPTYNRRHSLPAAIDSALAQSGVEVEVIVVDDGSTDGTVPWLERIYADRPVRVLPNAGLKGPAGARNTGISAARGEFIALLDSDDAFLPVHLQAAMACFADHPAVDVVFGRARYERNGMPEDYMGPNFDRKLALAPKSHQDDQLVVFTDGFFDHLLRYGCWFNLSTVVLRRATAAKGMNEQLRISEDYEFWVRLARQHRFGCLLQPQIRYTLHDDNLSFEAQATVADHAPSLLKALEVMRGYPGLHASGRQLIQTQMAQVMADWAWRCRQQGRLAEAASLHLRALPLGMRRHHLWALLKLAVFRASPGRRAQAQ